MQLTIEVPTSTDVTAAEVIEHAARGWGWDENHAATADEFVLDHLEQALYQRYLSGRVSAAKAQAVDDVPRPERRAVEAAEGAEGPPE